ncbi:Brl1p PWA37_003061 [Arxiozyma heterogenica]|uniref:Brl1p n=1 Tax=Arxiozyma heterogenica TaxID=278026 RepID=UPI002F153C97
MDQFGLLSLEDNDHEDIKLNSKILNLSLTDTNTIPDYDHSRNNEILLDNDVIVGLKEMTRNFHLDNNNNNNDIMPEPMEIDMNIDLEDLQTVAQETQSNSTNKDKHIGLIKDDNFNLAVDIESKEKVSEGNPREKSIVDDYLSEVESVYSKDTDTNIQNSQALTTVSKLLSPTQLGASLVTNHNNNNNNRGNNNFELSLDNMNSVNNNVVKKDSRMSKIKDNINSKDNYDMIRSNNEIWKQLLTDKQLINVNINNHNYFHPGNHPGMGLVNNNNNDDDDDNSDRNNNSNSNSNNLLPSPWSPNSTPYFKKWYDTISYVQWILNFGSIVFVIYLIISSMTKDLKAIWYQNKLLLINESQNCQLQYNLNNCDINFKLPEMSEICQDWWICWHRDNSKLIKNRTNLLIKFLSSLINEFFTELNIKTLIVAVILIFGWFFISNFTMGFIRAKSYYGNGYKKQ